MDELFLGIDIGTTVAKGVILDCNGNVLREYSVYHNYSKTVDYSVIWWNETCEIIKKLTESIDSNHLFSITISAMAPNLIFLGEDGDLVRETVLFTDEFALDIQTELDKQENTKWLNETISKLIRIRKDDKQWNRIACILTTHAYLAYRLSGILYCDIATAYEYGNIFSKELNRWDDGFLAKYSISSSIFPPIVNPSTTLGDINPEIAKQLDIPTTIKIVAGSHDSVASIIGSGLNQKEDVFLYYGTFNCSAFIHSNISDVLEGRVTCSPIEWVVSVPSAGPQFDQMCSIFSTGDYIEFENNAKKSRGGANGVIFLQHDHLLETSIGTKSRGAFVNISLESQKYDLCRAVFESFPYAIATFLDANKINIPEKCYIAGGGTKSSFRVQLVSDILNIEQYKLNNSENAVGTSLIGAFAYNKELYERIQNSRRNRSQVFVCKATKDEKVNYTENLSLYKEWVFPKR